MTGLETITKKEADELVKEDVGLLKYHAKTYLKSSQIVAITGVGFLAGYLLIDDPSYFASESSGIVTAGCALFSLINFAEGGVKMYKAMKSSMDYLLTPKRYVEKNYSKQLVE